MSILIISQEAPFDPTRVCTGNAFRTRQLVQALEASGNTCRQVWLGAAGDRSADCFHSADALQAIIRSSPPDVVLVSYWELLTLLPYGLEIPVVLDFVAPRPLEVLFEHPEHSGRQLRALRLALARADLLLVGNQQQETLLGYWLLEAGMDLRKGSRTRVVPLAGELVEGNTRTAQPAETGYTLVSGGVDWPWRQAKDYVQAIKTAEAESAGAIRLVQFGGRYRLQADSDDSAEADAADDGRWALTAYQDYSAFLSETAHIGLELSANNIERRFSQSFRSLDFLRHGLPLICNRHLPLAALIEKYEAGWLVDSPDEVAPLLKNLIKDPGQWQTRSENVTQLVQLELDPLQACAPLLTWLHAPDKAPRLPNFGKDDDTPAILGVPPLGERLKRRYRLARRVALARWLGPDPGADPTGNILMLSRGDLFPTDHGAAVKIVETARALSRQQCEVALVTDARDHYWLFRDGDATRMSLPPWLRALARPVAMTKLDHYTKDIPESNAFLYLPLSDGSFFWRALYVAGKYRVDVLHAEFPAYAGPLQEVGAILGKPVVMVEHNVEYQRLKDQVPDLDDERFLRFRAIEIQLANRSDAVVCVSDNDRRRLASDGVHDGLLTTIPHGIDLQSFDQASGEGLRKKLSIPGDAPVIAYHGTFSYPPNRRALQILNDEILPRLNDLGVQAHVLAIGHQPPSGVDANIHCTGSVENVASWLKAADIAVVTLQDGGGTRMKIIDYFAAGLPVISTSKGIEGIPASDGVEAIIRDDWQEISNAAAELFAHAEQRRSLATAGRVLAQSLDWNHIASRYLQLYRSIAR